jgi:hypothetical protein
MEQNKRNKIKILFLVLLLIKSLGYTEWEKITDGIEYQKFTLSDPNDVYVVRISRNEPSVLLDVGVGGGTIRDIREPVSKIVSRYQNIVNYYGQQYNILAAVNGDFFSYTTDQVTGGQVILGTYADKMGSRGKFAFKNLSSVFIDKTVSFSGKVTFADDSQTNINDINVPRGNNQLILYTFHYDYSTFTTADGCEVIVGYVNEPLSPNKEVSGVIREIRSGIGSALIPFDGFVLSASSSAATLLEQKCKVGDVIKVKLSITSSAGKDWTDVYSAIEGAQWFVSNGQLTSDLWEERHPRTAVAYNDNYIYLIVCDGRRSTSIGMKLSELGNFCIQYLQAKEALNLDGGGSSTMWVNGSVKNVPSDGTERSVANALFVAKTATDKSLRFNHTDVVKTITRANLKLGPGTQFGNITQLNKNTICVVSSSALNGVFAKGDYWWKIEYNNTEGWINQSVLSDTIAPAVPQLLYPQNNSQMVDRNPVFRWTSVEDPDGVYYTLVVSSNTDFTSKIVYELSLTTNYYVPAEHGDFKVNTTYYWYVTSLDKGENESVQSEIFSFVIISSGDVTKPGQVVSLEATPGWLTGSILLSWLSPGDDEYEGNIENGRYRIDYATYNKVIWSHYDYKINIVTSTPANVSQQFLVTGLTPNITYYFCLWTADKFFQWSEPSNIKLSFAKPLPATPRLLFPQNNCLFVTTNTVVLIWETDKEIVNNYLQISNLSNFTTLVASCSVVGNEYVFNNLSNGTYYWRIQGENRYNEKSLWSTYNKFYINFSSWNEINVLCEPLFPQEVNCLDETIDVYYNISVESKVKPIYVSSVTLVYQLAFDINEQNFQWNILPMEIDGNTGSYYTTIPINEKIRYFYCYPVIYTTTGEILQTSVSQCGYKKIKQQVIDSSGGKIILFNTNPYDNDSYVEIKQGVLTTEHNIVVEHYDGNLPSTEELPSVVPFVPLSAIKIDGLEQEIQKEYGICCIKYNKTAVENNHYDVKNIRMFYYNGKRWINTKSQLDTNLQLIKGSILGNGVYCLFVVSPNIDYQQYRPKQRIIVPKSNSLSSQIVFPVMTLYPDTEIKIYDVKGRHVRTLSNTDFWDGRDKNGSLLPGGSYIYKYKINGQVYTGTIVILN